MAEVKKKVKPPECGTRIEKGHTAYPCPLDKGHDGPCATPEVDKSVRERARWEEDLRAKATLAAHQGEPLTTAQRNTENPTPVPQTKGQKAEARDDAKWAAEQAEVKARTAAAADEAKSIAPLQASWAKARSEEQAAVMARMRAQLVEIIGEEAVVKIEGGVEGGMAAAAEVLAERERQARPLMTLDAGGVPHPAPTDPRLGVHPGPTKTRPGDQRLPVASDHPGSHALVQADLAERLRVGVERYGQPLQALNGRNGFQDAYEEALDLSVYLRTLMVEREVMATLAATLKNRLGYLQVVLADLQIEAHATYQGPTAVEDTPVDVVLVHPAEMEAIDRLVAWLTA